MALATSFGMLAVSRFLLGMGEGGGFPAATKSVYEWFSVRERSLAMGIMNAGTAVGAVAAPPLIAIILSFASWRWVFLLSGCAGLVWASGGGTSTLFPPTIHASRPRKAVTVSLVASEADRFAIDLPCPGFNSFQQPEVVWALMSAKFLSDAAWYFYLFWLPKYLFDVRHFDMKQVGYSAWVPTPHQASARLWAAGFRAG